MESAPVCLHEFPVLAPQCTDLSGVFGDLNNSKIRNGKPLARDANQSFQAALRAEEPTESTLSHHVAEHSARRLLRTLPLLPKHVPPVPPTFTPRNLKESAKEPVPPAGPYPLMRIQHFC